MIVIIIPHSSFHFGLHKSNLIWTPLPSKPPTASIIEAYHCHHPPSLRRFPLVSIHNQKNASLHWFPLLCFFSTHASTHISLPMDAYIQSQPSPSTTIITNCGVPPVFPHQWVFLLQFWNLFSERELLKYLYRFQRPIRISTLSTTMSISILQFSLNPPLTQC